MTTQRQVQFRDLQNALNQWIGFDYLLTGPTPAKPTFPPYDIVRKGDDYNIIIALAGYKADDISITHKENVLYIESARLESPGVPLKAEDEVEYLHRGIAKRSFKLTFNLSPEVEVLGSTLVDGILTTHLHRVVPEAKLPKKIPIISG